MSNGSYVRRAGTTEVVLVPMLEASEDHVERLLAEKERLRAALKQYGQHKYRCRANEVYLDAEGNCRGGIMPCDCGFDVALKGDAK